MKKIILSVSALILLALTVLALPALLPAGILGAALISYGPNINEFRKKLGNTVFSRNHYGSFARKNTKPINPRTSYQSAARAIVKYYSKAWKGLDQGVQLAFIQLAKNRPFKNRLAQLIHLTGEATYIALNANSEKAGGAGVATAPSQLLDIVEPLITFSAAAVHAGDVTLTFTPAISANQKLCVYSSGEVSPGKRYNSKWNLFGVEADTVTSPAIITTQYNARFGAVSAAGNKIFFQAEVVDPATGFVSQKINCSCITT